MLTISDIATRVGVSRQTVTAWLNSGKLPYKGKKGKRFVRKCDLEAYLEDRRRPQVSAEQRITLLEERVARLEQNVL